MTLYRFFEILPGVLAWTTLILTVVLSRYAPFYVAIFIIFFDVYWLLKTIYLSFYLRATFKVMTENAKISWREKLSEVSADVDWKEIYHLVVFPMAHEPYDVVRESFETLSKAHYPKDKFLVVLAIEERAGQGAKEVAQKIEAEFGGMFRKFLVTVHPVGLPDEIPGKGSNETWSVQRAKEVLIDALHIPYDRVIVSAFDIDTQILPEYFGRLTYVFLNAKDRLRAIYQPVPFFTNNVYQSPALARIVSFSATFWQMMQQSRPERLTSFSSQSIPLPVLIDVGFWQKDIVSEDSRIFWQAYLHYDGDFRVEPLLCSVSMDANAAPGFLATMKNLYKQQRRWAWGVENTPYILAGLIARPNIPTRKKWFWAFIDLEGRHSWATNALLIFALGWLPVVLGQGSFTQTLLAYNLPEITQFIVRLSMIGVATSAIFTFALLPPRPTWFRPYHYGLYLLQWVLMPFTLIIFGCVPALDAQTRLMLGGKFRLGFWITPKSRIS